eukprot:413514-Pleurochrysis_carterae.AAC.1
MLDGSPEVARARGHCSAECAIENMPVMLVLKLGRGTWMPNRDVAEIFGSAQCARAPLPLMGQTEVSIVSAVLGHRSMIASVSSL